MTRDKYVTCAVIDLETVPMAKFSYAHELTDIFFYRVATRGVLGLPTTGPALTGEQNWTVSLLGQDQIHL